MVQEQRWSYEAFMALPHTTLTADVHCVTIWSLLGSAWEGVHVRELLREVQFKPAAHFVMQHCAGGYTTNLPLETFMDDDALLRYRRDGEDITSDYGWPFHLVVPKRYCWKSAKWVRGLEFMAQDKLGFGENPGHNNRADPWLEERFS